MNKLLEAPDPHVWRGVCIGSNIHFITLIYFKWNSAFISPIYQIVTCACIFRGFVFIHHNRQARHKKKKGFKSEKRSSLKAKEANN